MSGGRFGVSQLQVPAGCAALWRIFSSNKSVPANRKNSMQTICRRMRRLEGFLYAAAKIFQLFSKNSKSKYKTFSG
jgi:hypothetical protein